MKFILILNIMNANGRRRMVGIGSALEAARFSFPDHPARTRSSVKIHIASSKNLPKRSLDICREIVENYTFPWRRGTMGINAFITKMMPEETSFVPFRFRESPANKLLNNALDLTAKIPGHKACVLELD